MSNLTSKSELTFLTIVNAALDLSAEQGLESISLGEVAKRLGISKSGVFSRVGSREALQQAVLEEFDRRFMQEVFMPALALPRGLPRLDALVNGWVRRTCNSDPGAGCLYMAGAFEYDDMEAPMREHLRANVQALRGMLCRMVAQALEVGHLAPDTNPEQLVFQIHSLMLGLMHDARFLRDNNARKYVRTAYEALISMHRHPDCTR